MTKGNYFVNNFVAMDGDSPHVAGGARLAAADYPHWTVAANVWAVEGNATLGMDCSTSGPDLSTTTAAAAAAGGPTTTTTTTQVLARQHPERQQQRERRSVSRE